MLGLSFSFSFGPLYFGGEMMILSGGMNVGLCMFSGHLSPVVVDWTATVVVVTVTMSSTIHYK